jgi:peptidoglycan pentaglycine glycine transferase (the first glycine)
MMLISLSEWNKFISTISGAHVMQHGAWGEFKSQFGWSAYRIKNGDSGAQVLIRDYPFGFRFAYIPKGPLGGNWNSLIPELHEFCKKKQVFVLRIEPNSWEAGSKQLIKMPEGFFQSIPIQPQRTIVVDLRCSEDDMLMRMKQKTRYNIRLAIKKGVSVARSKDVNKFYELMLKTGERDQFGIHNLSYYQNAYDIFSKYRSCELFLASHEGLPLAGLMVFVHGSRAWYFYGASNNQARDRMPTYLLQWETMCWAKKMGCLEYDLWGVPDEDEPTLEKEFANRSDGLWGVYRFKRGFGGQLQRSSGAWDYIYSPLRYKLFLLILKLRKIQLA